MRWSRTVVTAHIAHSCFSLFFCLSCPQSAISTWNFYNFQTPVNDMTYSLTTTSASLWYHLPSVYKHDTRTCSVSSNPAYSMFEGPKVIFYASCWNQRVSQQQRFIFVCDTSMSTPVRVKPTIWWFIDYPYRPKIKTPSCGIQRVVVL